MPFATGINSPVFLITIGCGPEIGISGSGRSLSMRIRVLHPDQGGGRVRTAHDEDESVRICGVAPASADRSRGGLGGTFDRLRGRERVLKKGDGRRRFSMIGNGFAMP